MTKSRFFIIMCIVLLSGLRTYSQNNTESIPSQSYTPPVAERISVTQSEDYIVRVTGEANSVAPSTQIVIRNLYTKSDSVLVSSPDGSFSTTIGGLDNMLYLIAYYEGSPIRSTLEPLDGVGIIIYPETVYGENISVGIGGNVSFGYLPWFAEVNLNQTNFTKDDRLAVSMNVIFYNADSFILERDHTYQMQGHLALYDIADANGVPSSNEIRLNDKGTFEFLSNDLPLLRSTIVPIPIIIPVSTVETDDIDIIGTDMSFNLNFETSLPDNIISGTYMLVFTGMMSVDDNDFELWYESRHFAWDGTNGIMLMATARPHPILVPVVITVEDAEIQDGND